MAPTLADIAHGVKTDVPDTAAGTMSYSRIFVTIIKFRTTAAVLQSNSETCR